VRAAVALLACGALSACITVSEFRALEREVNEVRVRQRAQVTGAGGDVRLAELGAQVEEMQREVAKLRGSVEEARHTAEQALRQAQSTSAPGGAPPAVEAPAGPMTPGMTTTSQEVRDYEEAWRLYRAADYARAIDRFEALLQNYPSSEYTDNALFWMGECQLRLGDPERAVLTFEDVVRRYPDGNKVPDALYRQGIAMLEIGRKTGEEANYAPAAREIFERIVSDYPDSERVPEAQRQLEKLGP
jgi:tol-pal system protein YbgF